MVVVVDDVMVDVVVGMVDVVDGTVSLNAGTQTSSTAFATSTAGPKLPLFTETVCGGNFVPAGSFAW